MDEQLIGYLLDALDERTKRQVEVYLAQHPEACEKLSQLRQALDPLAADREGPAPPPLLAERTLARVAEYICNEGKRADELPHSPPIAVSARRNGRSWWRRADVLVAACVLFTLGGIGLVVLGRLRDPAMIVECKNNLRQFYTALQQYRDQHGRFPDVVKESPRDVAGMVVPILSEAGTLPQSTSIRCPGIGTPLANNFSLTALHEMSDDDFERRSPNLSMCYAYSLGYRDPGGAYHGPGDDPKAPWSQTPIMADRPPVEEILGNSINHGGNGQNVLFADGHVYFMPERTFGGDDIFLNRAKKLAAGLDPTDIVLGPSAARP